MPGCQGRAVYQNAFTTLIHAGKDGKNRGGGRTLGLLGVCPVLQAGRIATTLAVSRDVTGRKAASAAAEALQYALDAKSTTAKE